MIRATCAVSDCDQVARSLTAHLCDMHYKRNWRYGRTDVVRPNKRTVWDRFWEKVDASGDCWEWTASTRGAGYGQFGWTPYRIIEAHRAAWELLIGPIPDGMVIDHLCENKICVNPDHLQVTTRAHNSMRSGRSVAAINAAKTHCSQGHPFHGKNLRINIEGRRRCKTCDRAVNRRAYWKRKELDATGVL